MANPSGVCRCGCGDPVKRHARTNRRRGEIKGEYCDFRPGHFSKTSQFGKIMASLDPGDTKHVGASNGNWSGGRFLDAQGYVLVRVRPGEVRREHRVVMEQVFGRLLKKAEVVHHKDGDRTNNDPTNLEVMTQAEHAAVHLSAERAMEMGRRGGVERGRRARIAALTALGHMTEGRADGWTHDPDADGEIPT